MASWDAVLINFLPSMMMMLMWQVIDKECDWNDGVCLAKKLGTEQAEFLIGMHPITRETLRNVPPVLFEGKPYAYKGPPGLGVVGDFNEFAAGFSRDELGLSTLFKAHEIGGVLFRYPAGQINDTLKGIIAIGEGDVEGLEQTHALMSGPPPK